MKEAASFISFYLIPFFFLTGQLIGQEVDKGFVFYSTQDHKSLHFKTTLEWQKQQEKIREAMSKVMGDLPAINPDFGFDLRFIDTLESETYFRYHLSFAAIADERVTIYLYIPKGKDNEKIPAILALHPTGELGKRIVDGEGLSNRSYARELAERGYIVIAPDYPGFGELSDFDFQSSHYASGTITGIFYHMRCLDLLAQLEEVDPDRLGVIGHSLGGHNAMFVAAFDPRLKVIVSSCGWTPFKYYDIGPSAEERFGGRLGPWAQDKYMPRIRNQYQLDETKIPFDFPEIIGVLAPRPFFSNSPVNDANFSSAGVKEGIKEARKVYGFFSANENLQVHYPEAEHDFPTDIRRRAYEFIDHHLNFTGRAHQIE